MSIKLQFKKQDFQQRAVDSIAGKDGILNGQSLADSIYTIKQGLFDATAQQVTISKEQMLENINTVQKKNGLQPSTSLDLYEVRHKYKDDNGKDKENEFLNITCEMETGTGKTFVYMESDLL